jgi:hypothetical protein
MVNKMTASEKVLKYVWENPYEQNVEKRNKKKLKSILKFLKIIMIRLTIF